MTLDHAGAHEATYRRLMAALSSGRDQEADELLAAEFVDHNPMPGQPPGPAGFKEWMRATRAVFPDLTATVQDVVVDRDRLAARVRYRGTHGGTFLGIAATGREVDFEAFHFTHFRTGASPSGGGRPIYSEPSNRSAPALLRRSRGSAQRPTDLWACRP